jgi:hypothetical protein
MSKKIERLRELRDAVQSDGFSLIPPDKLPKEPTDEVQWKAHYKKIFDPKNFNSPELDTMSVQELRDKLAELRANRKRMGLPPADPDKTLDEIWKKRQKHR